MNETTTTDDAVLDAVARRQKLEAELALIAEQERAEAAERHRQQQELLDAQLDPEMREQKEAIERRAREALDREFPPSWTPQKKGSSDPPELIGLVLRIDPRVGPSKTFLTYSAVIEVRATDGKEWTVWANESGALYAQLVRLRIQPGEVIAIRYRGLRESSTNYGQTYHDFKLARIEEDEGPPQPIDYDALVQQSHEAPALPAGQVAKMKDDIPF